MSELGRFATLGMMLLGLAGCSSVLGFDDISFDDQDGGAQSGGAPAGGVGGVASGGASAGGTSSGGTSAGGTSGGGTSAGGTGGATGGTSSGGSSAGGTSAGGGGAPSGGGTGGGSSDPHATYRQQCVDQINQYRSTLGLPPYQRWTQQESCADGQAQSDSQTGKAHGAFGQCGEWAQNECPGYPSLSSTVTTCLAQMWAEGPGADFQTHGHYINMTSTQYTKVACGFHESSKGVWAVQDFQ